jgi:hypothetical protein
VTLGTKRSKKILYKAVIPAMDWPESSCRDVIPDSIPLLLYRAGLVCNDADYVQNNILKKQFSRVRDMGIQNQSTLKVLIEITRAS